MHRCALEMASVGHLVEIAIGGEVAMIRIGNGGKGGTVWGDGHKEAEVSGDGKSAT